MEIVKNIVAGIGNVVMTNRKVLVWLLILVVVLAFIRVKLNKPELENAEAPTQTQSNVEVSVQASDGLVIMSGDLAQEVLKEVMESAKSNPEEKKMSLEEIESLLRMRLTGTQDGVVEEPQQDTEKAEDADNKSDVNHYNSQDIYIKELLTSKNGNISRYMVIKLIEIRNFLTVNILNSGFYSIQSYAVNGKDRYGNDININILLSRMSTNMERKRGYDELFSQVSGEALMEIARAWQAVSKEIDAKYNEVIKNPPVKNQPYNINLSSLEAAINQYYSVLDKYNITL